MFFFVKTILNIRRGRIINCSSRGIVHDHKISSFDCTKKVAGVLANMHSLSLRETASHFARKQKQEVLRILRVLYSQEWEKPYEHLTTDARSRVADIASRVLFGNSPPPISAS
jgi:hypothetical protein